MPLNASQLQALHLASAPRWQPAVHLTGAPAGAWRSWLQESGSLTRRLQGQAQVSFQVEVLDQGVRPIHQVERQWLQVTHNHIWVRQVLLKVDDQPWVFARSLLPLDTRGNLLRRLTGVGQQALGQLLFSQPDIQRGELRFCAPDQLPFSSLWGRASCFYSGPLRLLVAEHYLPPMAEALQLPTHRIFGD
ncbi:chorismate--pyruvate lyase family protein [Marinospirillum sp.]|uniref:chorismate--pyruvate lyase family protein n=1 Tax=Marinospirillum sp. TaxID=2183934 RepID=UPI003A8AD512